MTVFKYFQKVDTLISYECNSSSPFTFVEIRLHAIVILQEYLLIMFVACSTFFLKDGLKKSEHRRLTNRIRTELLK